MQLAKVKAPVFSMPNIFIYNNKVDLIPLTNIVQGYFYQIINNDYYYLYFPSIGKNFINIAHDIYKLDKNLMEYIYIGKMKDKKDFLPNIESDIKKLAAYEVLAQSSIKDLNKFPLKLLSNNNRLAKFSSPIKKNSVIYNNIILDPTQIVYYISNSTHISFLPFKNNSFLSINNNNYQIKNFKIVSTDFNKNIYEMFPIEQLSIDV